MDASINPVVRAARQWIDDRRDHLLDDVMAILPGVQSEATLMEASLRSMELLDETRASHSERIGVAAIQVAYRLAIHWDPTLRWILEGRMAEGIPYLFSSRSRAVCDVFPSVILRATTFERSDKLISNIVHDIANALLYQSKGRKGKAWPFGFVRHQSCSVGDVVRFSAANGSLTHAVVLHVCPPSIEGFEGDVVLGILSRDFQVEKEDQFPLDAVVAYAWSFRELVSRGYWPVVRSDPRWARAVIQGRGEVFFVDMVPNLLREQTVEHVNVCGVDAITGQLKWRSIDSVSTSKVRCLSMHLVGTTEIESFARLLASPRFTQAFRVCASATRMGLDWDDL
jgi:hypothetical protein